MAAGGGGIELGGVEPGGVELGGGVEPGGVELGGVLGGWVVVVTGAVVDGVATVVDVGAGFTPYAAAGADTDATMTATRAIPPRGNVNIGISVGIRATDLQRSPRYPGMACRVPPV
jgi:hypothetical protein